MKSGLVPKMFSFQLGGKSDVTGMAGILMNMLLSKQLVDCHQGHGADITIKAGELCRYVARESQ